MDNKYIKALLALNVLLCIECLLIKDVLSLTTSFKSINHTCVAAKALDDAVTNSLNVAYQDRATKQFGSSKLRVNNNHSKLSSSISKADIKTLILDSRQNKLVVGESPNISWAFKSRVKYRDKKGIIFPYLKHRLSSRLYEAGFSESNNAKHSLEISFLEIFYQINDKFSHIQINQTCSVKITLKNGNEPLFSKTMDVKFSSKRAELKRMGYSMKKQQFLGILCDQIVEKILVDSEFNKLVEN